MLKHYRGFDFPSSSAQFKAYLARLFDHPAFKATCSTEQLYLDSYERCVFLYFLLIMKQGAESCNVLAGMRLTDRIRARSRRLSIAGGAYRKPW